MRRCWAAFHQNEGILKADALAEAFGDVADPASGYGDAAEAYCALRSALDQSDAESLRAVGNGLRYAPLMPSERAPSMENVWREVGPVFDLDGGTLVAFDLAWRPLDAPSVRALVLACGEAPDGYALSSLICATTRRGTTSSSSAWTGASSTSTTSTTTRRTSTSLLKR